MTDDLSRAPRAVDVGRWTRAQGAEGAFWCPGGHSHGAELTSEQRQASAPRELGDFDFDGVLTRRLAEAQNVVEIGAGPLGLIHFMQTPANRIALDPLMVAVEQAGYNDHFGALRVQAVGEAIPLQSGSCDIALCYNALDHCQDPLGVMREMNRILRPGGTLLLELHLIRSWAGPLEPLLARLDPPHPYHFTRGDALTLASVTGFRLECDGSFRKPPRTFPIRQILTYNAIRHIGSTFLTGQVGVFRLVKVSDSRR